VLARVDVLRERLGGASFQPMARPACPEAGLPHARSLAHVERMLSHPEVGVRGMADEGPSSADVALFAGCVPFLDALVDDDIEPRASESLPAALKLMSLAGVRPALVVDGRTCGHGLDAEDASRLARLNAEAVECTGARTVVTLCSLAAARLGRALVESGMDGRVVHLSVFLDEAGVVPPAGEGAVSLVDDPADGAVRAASTRLLRASGRRVVRVRPARYSGRRVDLAAGLARARTAGANVLVTTSIRPSLPARYMTRPGTWDTSGLRVSDLATFLGGGKP
jgi:hypothetical protein